ncbi:hypothetical protein ACFSJS_16060 [Streptomyces desertarenae]|uniref:Uncharacterized protein n=1 Tax=Streptomyces desertarenae TaxID=2666184 RepID=A0ABW4PKA6_9ACTN
MRYKKTLPGHGVQQDPTGERQTIDDEGTHVGGPAEAGPRCCIQAYGSGSVGRCGHHSLAVVSGGTARARGHNPNGELGDGTATNRTTPVLAIAENSYTTKVAAPVLGQHSYAG